MAFVKKIQNLAFAGHVLLYSIVIVLLISLSLFFLYTDLLFRLKSDSKFTLNIIGRSAMYEGFNLLNGPDVRFNNLYSYPFDKRLNLNILKKRWGNYNLYYSTFGNDTLILTKKAGIIGYEKTEKNNVALNLENTNSHLYILGSVDINGQLRVPFGYVKPYDLHDVYSINKSALKSNDTFHVLKNYELIKTWLEHEANLTPGQTWCPHVVKVSFWDSTLRISTDSIVVTGQIEGNVILSAEYTKIARTANINDAIIISKTLVIESGFSGSMQIFATEKIIIDSSVSLKYPSTLCFFPSGSNSGTQMLIGSSFNIAGEVYCYSDNYIHNIKNQFVIEKESEIFGGIFTSTGLVWEGVCRGTITCPTINSYSIPQKNLLSNSTIDIRGLPDYYSYSILYPYGETEKIVKWVE